MSSTINFITGMTSVYYAAAELSERGFIVTVTARNAPHADIIASTIDMKKTFSIQVKGNKAGGTQSFWLLNKDSKNLSSQDFFYVFVNLKKDIKPDFYIVPSGEVARNVDFSRAKTGSQWYSFRRDEKYKDKWST